MVKELLLDSNQSWKQNGGMFCVPKINENSRDVPNRA